MTGAVRTLSSHRFERTAQREAALRRFFAIRGEQIIVVPSGWRFWPLHKWSRYEVRALG